MGRLPLERLVIKSKTIQMTYTPKFILKILIIAPLCLCFSNACKMPVYDEGNRYYLKEKLPPKTVGQVEVFHNEEPKRKYTIIADLQGKRHTVDSLRERAAEIGADAVIITKTGGYIGSGDTKWAGKDTGKTNFSGTAIIYE